MVCVTVAEAWWCKWSAPWTSESSSCFYRHIVYLQPGVQKCLRNQTMVVTGQEIVREKKILQGQGSIREFYSGSGKIGI